MAFRARAFNPTTGLLDTITYVTTPADETAARQQFQTVIGQVKTMVDNLVSDLSGTDSGTSGAEYVGSALVSGVTGTTVRAQIADLKTQIDNIVAGSVSDGSITTAKLAADAVTGAQIADDAVDSEHYVDGSIDTAHLSADCVTGAKIADDTIDSEHYAALSIDAEHISTGAITSGKLAASAVATANIADAAVGTTQLSAALQTIMGYLSTVSSNVQTQINAKQATITGGATTIDTENLTASRALASNGSGKVAVSATTSTELGYLSGVTSAVQTQLSAKFPTAYVIYQSATPSVVNGAIWLKPL